MAAPWDIVVRGSGCVALSAALALGRRGLSVALAAHSPAGAAAEDVRAYALNHASVALLRSLKVWDALAADAVTPVQDMRVHGDAGAELQFSAWQQGREALAWIVDAAALEQALREAARYAPHVQLVEAKDLAAGGATLTVHAEGRHSQARARLGVAMPVQAYGHRGVAARLEADRPHAGTAWQWFRQPDVLALLPFDRPAAGHGYGLVWSVPDARAEALLAMPQQAFEQALMDATGGGAGRLRLASPRSAWPLAMARADRVAGPGWVLVGDAAHLVHPLAGQGLNLGLADVVALDAVLVERESWRSLGDERLLQRYARRRAAPTWAMAQLTDGLWRLFATEQPVLRELRNQGMTLVNKLPPLKRWLTGQAVDG